MCKIGSFGVQSSSFCIALFHSPQPIEFCMLGLAAADVRCVSGECSRCMHRGAIIHRRRRAHLALSLSLSLWMRRRCMQVVFSRFALRPQNSAATLRRLFSCKSAATPGGRMTKNIQHFFDNMPTGALGVCCLRLAFVLCSHFLRAARAVARVQLHPHPPLV
jgi:hypothetical protein